MSNALLTEEELVDLILRGAGDDEEVPLAPENLDDSFEDVGLDSLAIMECLSLMKRERGIALDADVIDSIESPRDLLNLANEFLKANAA